jgi:hypothetical protein
MLSNRFGSSLKRSCTNVGDSDEGRISAGREVRLPTKGFAPGNGPIARFDPIVDRGAGIRGPLVTGAEAV